MGACISSRPATRRTPAGFLIDRLSRSAIVSNTNDGIQHAVANAKHVSIASLRKQHHLLATPAMQVNITNIFGRHGNHQSQQCLRFEHERRAEQSGGGGERRRFDRRPVHGADGERLHPEHDGRRRRCLPWAGAAFPVGNCSDSWLRGNAADMRGLFSRRQRGARRTSFARRDGFMCRGFGDDHSDDCLDESQRPPQAAFLQRFAGSSRSGPLGLSAASPRFDIPSAL